jgi:hypothetical protein
MLATQMLSHLSSSTSPIFVLGISEKEFLKLLAQAGLELKSSEISAS